MIHGPGRKRLTAEDLKMLADIGGDVPFLGFSFYSIEDWAKIVDLGYTDIVLRAWHDRGTLPPVHEFCEALRPVLDYLLGRGCRVAMQLVNEPRLELDSMSIAELIDWLEAAARWFRQHYPMVELITPPLSVADPHAAWAYLEQLRPCFGLFDSLGIHYYLHPQIDSKPGQPFTPEWWRAQFPELPQRITETGAGDGVGAEFRHLAYPGMCRRFGALSYVLSYHVYLMSSDDEHWRRLGHFYDAQIVEILAVAAGEWRARQEEVRPVGIAAAGNYRFSLGFAEYAKAHPKVGQPASPLQYDANGNGYQYTTAGKLEWCKASNTIYFFKKTG